MQRKQRLFTVGEIARQFGVPIHRVEYAIRRRQIEPIGWAGHARVFDDSGVQQIKEALVGGQDNPLLKPEGEVSE